MRKYLAPVLSALLVVGGVFVALQGGTGLLVLGILMVAAGGGLLAIWATVLRDPQAAVERLVARRAELERRTGRGQETTDGPEKH